MKRDLDRKTYEEVVRDIYQSNGKDNGVSILQDENRMTEAGFLSRWNITCVPETQQL
jgi:hypothetical protein